MARDIKAEVLEHVVGGTGAHRYKLRMTVDNENPFELHVENLDHELDLTDQTVLEGLVDAHPAPDND